MNDYVVIYDGHTSRTIRSVWKVEVSGEWLMFYDRIGVLITSVSSHKVLQVNKR